MVSVKKFTFDKDLFSYDKEIWALKDIWTEFSANFETVGGDINNLSNLIDPAFINLEVTGDAYYSGKGGALYFDTN